jgi:hypothetical protein
MFLHVTWTEVLMHFEMQKHSTIPNGKKKKKNNQAEVESFLARHDVNPLDVPKGDEIDGNVDPSPQHELGYLAPNVALSFDPLVPATTSESVHSKHELHHLLSMLNFSSSNFDWGLLLRAKEDKAFLSVCF